MDFLFDTHIWYSFSFLVFLVVFLRFGKSMIERILDERIAKIREEIETAENLRVEAQELLAQYQRKQRDALKEAESIISTAQQNAEEFRKQAEQDLEDTMARREKQLQQRLHRMEQNAKQDIQRYAAELAMEATSQMIAQNMDKKTSQRLVKQAIENVSKNLH